MKTSNLNMRIDPNLREQAEAIYRGFGITITDAVNMFLAKSIIENGLPFELRCPRYNAETEAAIAEGKTIAAEIKAGKRKGYASAKEMFASMGI